MNKYYITTPIYYVNDKPHLGHAYSTLVADVMARYMRHKLGEKQVFFLTGTDEHGTKVAESAEKQGKTPQEFCDQISAMFKQNWQALNVSHNKFIRTTSNEHKDRVKQIFEKLHQAKTPQGNSVIYADTYEGLYCTGCEKFLTEKELVDNKCPHHNQPLEKLSEKNYFFRLSDYKKTIKEKIKNNEFLILPDSRKNEALSMLEFVDDFSISRESVKWGIELPFDSSQKSYVWVDALSNYLTAIGYPDDNSYQNWWPADMQLMAQDILKFHTIYWPAMLLALDLELPKKMYIHGFFTVNGQKMSKSLGNAIDPSELVEKYGAGPLRYLLLSQFAFGYEADIQVERFREKYNADLANGLGNLVARVSNLLEKNKIETNLEFKSDSAMVKKFVQKIEDYKFNEALQVLWAELRSCDEKITNTKPWKMEDKKEIKEILHPVAQTILNVAHCLKPVMPSISVKIIEQFSLEQIKKGKPLFPRIS